MAKYGNTKAKINEKIATNGRQAVTGTILNDVLQTMVDSLGADYQFGGLVQPGSSFTAGEQPVVFLATTPGTYTNFGGLVVADGEVALLVWSGTAWSKQTPDIATRTEVSQLGQELEHTRNKTYNITFSQGDLTGDGESPSSKAIRSDAADVYPGETIKVSVLYTGYQFAVYKVIAESPYVTPQRILGTSDWTFTNNTSGLIQFRFKVKRTTDVEIVPTEGANILVFYPDEKLVFSGSVINSLIRLVGFNATMGGGDSGVTKVGDCFYHQQGYIARCTAFVSSTNFTAEKVPFVDGAIYTYQDHIYTSDGTQIVFVCKNQKKRLDSITNISNKANSNVTKVGDVYFNINDNLLHTCTVYRSTGDFDDVTSVPDYDTYYVLGTIMYIYNGTTLVTELLTNTQIQTAIQNAAQTTIDRCIRLVGFNATMGAGDSGVTKVGDCFYHQQGYIARCTSFTSATDFTFEQVPFQDGAVYTYQNKVYTSNGTQLIFVCENDSTALHLKQISNGLFVGSNVESIRLSSMINGKGFSDELQSPLVDFAKEGDKMVHTSSFVIIDDIVYSVFMVNYIDSGETPSKLNIRLQYAPLSDLTDISYVDISSIGDTYSGKSIEKIYDSVLYEKDGLLYILWNAQLTGEGYSILYKTFNPSTGVLSDASICSFSVNGNSSDFEQVAIKNLLSANGVDSSSLFGHLVIMPKISTRTENGTDYYYTGLGCAGQFNCIIKTSDFVNWVYVSSPDFYNEAIYEPAVYVVGDDAYYYCRQTDNNKYGFLTKYSIPNNSWDNPVYVEDAQSRPDFLYINGDLFLIYAPKDRNHIAIMRIDKTNISRSIDVQVAKVPDYFYPFAQIYNGNLFMQFTQSRLHIYLSTFYIRAIDEDSVISAISNLLNP